MPLLFDRGRLLEECGDALAVLDCLDRGDRHDLADALDALRFAHETRVCHFQANAAREGFDARHPAAAASLAAFDRIRGRVVRRGSDFWLAPSKRRALEVLAAKAAELLVALGGEPTATDWLGGSLTELTYAVSGNKARRPTSYFLGLQEAGRIEFRETAAIGRRKYQVRVLDPGEHRLAKERLAEFRARKRPGRDR